MMDGVETWHILAFFGYLFVFAYPVSIVLRRVGYSPWLALVGVVPGLNFVALWLFAHAPWPNFPTEKEGRA